MTICATLRKVTPGTRGLLCQDSATSFWNADNWTEVDSSEGFQQMQEGDSLWAIPDDAIEAEDPTDGRQPDEGQRSGHYFLNGDNIERSTGDFNISCSWRAVESRIN